MRIGGRIIPILLLLTLTSNCHFIPRPADPWYGYDDVDTNVDIPVFPPGNPWNTDISKYQVLSNSDDYVATIGVSTHLHPDFGTIWNEAPNGIPFIVVDRRQPAVPVVFGYAAESDPGPYPIPNDAPIEGGPFSSGDRHVLIIDRHHQRLYELFSAYPRLHHWQAGSGAIWDLTAVNPVRPKYCTSADAAGLPIFPGLVRYDEAAGGEIKHAFRFTVSATQQAFIPPASHYASSITDADYPPMGLRFRLKAGFDISGFSPINQTILTALKKYGMIVADNGGDWFLSGAPDKRWDDDDLHNLQQVTGGDFEAVYTGDIQY